MGPEAALYLSPETVKALMQKKGMQERELLLSLVTEVAELARPPLSKFHVGAAGLGKSGAVYLGMNLEFEGVPLYNTVHAEQFVVANALHHRETQLLFLAVNAVPCGHCRQFLSELHHADQLKLVFKDIPTTEWRLEDLLPMRFKPQDVLGEKSSCGIMSPSRPLSLRWTKEAIDEIQRHKGTPLLNKGVKDALEAASRSYVPYSQCPSAVSIITKDGDVFSGGTIENCAYNPTLAPFQSAIISAIAHGKLPAYTEISFVILAELGEMPQVSQAAAVRSIVKRISKEATVVVLSFEQCD